MTSHVFHLASKPPQKSAEKGYRIDATQLDMHLLSGMALSLLVLEPSGMREPHWHPNADELGYCIEGKALMTIFNPGADHDTFLIEPGTLSFVPKGSLHNIENLGDKQVKMLLCFDHETPEDLDLSSGVGAMPDQILGATFDLHAQFFADLHADVQPIFIADKNHHPQTKDVWKTNPFKMDIDSTKPEVDTTGGWVKMSNSFLFPKLNGLAMYRVELLPKGVREPHWHPNAHELNYLIKGSARITLLSPGGSVDTFEMKAGNMSFLPQGYLHHIENTGNEPASFAIFFNHINPSDIGFSGSLGAYSNEVLSSVFKVSKDYFDKLPKYQSDLFVVKGGG